MVNSLMFGTKIGKLLKNSGKKERIQSLDQAFESLATFNGDNTVDITSLADSMGVTEKTIRNRLKEHGGFWIDEGKVGKK